MPKARKFSYKKVDDDTLIDYYKNLFIERAELKRLGDVEGLSYNQVEINFTTHFMKERGLLNVANESKRS